MSVKYRFLTAGLLLAGAIFTTDLHLGPHLAAELAYTLPIVLSLGSRRPDVGLWFAALATTLICLASFSHIPAASAAYIADRGIAVLVICLVAILCFSQSCTRNRLDQARAILREKGDDAAAIEIQAEKDMRSERLQRHRVEEVLEESEHRFAGVFNQAFQFVAILRPSGAMEDANETLRGIASMKSDELPGPPVWEFDIWDTEGRTRLREAVGRGVGRLFSGRVPGASIE